MNTSQAPPKLVHIYRQDSLRLDEKYYTDEGYLISTPIVTSIGVFEYKNPDGSIRRELRLPEQVFDGDSLMSYEGKPVIITHEAGRVTKENVGHEIVGTIMGPGYRDGDDVRCKVVIHEIDKVKRSGLRELSLGYDLDIDETPGVWDGQRYDAIQTNIRINHLALVRDARAGDQARLNIDSKDKNIMFEGGYKMSANKTSAALDKLINAYKERRATRLDAEEENPQPPAMAQEQPAPDQPEQQPTDKLQFVKDRRDRRDEEGDPETPEAAMGQIAQMDEDIGTLLDLIEELQAKSDFSESAPPDKEDDEFGEEEEPHGGGTSLTIQLDAMDAIVRERLKLGRLGDSLNLDGLEDMNPVDAKKAIVKKVNPGMRLDGKSPAYVNAAFDAAVAQIGAGGVKNANYQRRQMTARADSAGSPGPSTKTGAASARERMIDRMMNGGNAE